MGSVPIFPLVSSLFLVGCATGSTNPDPARDTGSSNPQSEAVRTVRPGDSLRIPGDATYPTIYVGTTLWMASNLEFRTDTIDTLSWCPPEGCQKHGRLYSWRAAMRADSTINTLCDVYLPRRGICPAGWHLPSSDEWNALAASMGGMDRLGVLLESRSGWDPPLDETKETPTDSVGFQALPAGYRFTGDQGYGTYGHSIGDSAFLGTGSTAAFWSRTNKAPGTCWSAYALFLYKDQPNGSLILVPRSSGLSVRCVKDSG